MRRIIASVLFDVSFWLDEALCALGGDPCKPPCWLCLKLWRLSDHFDDGPQAY